MDTTSPDTENLRRLLQCHWDFIAEEIQPLGAGRVFRVTSAQRTLILRSIPDGHGPTHPVTVVDFLQHLSRCSAPVPQLLPTTCGEPCAVEDRTLFCVETELPGAQLDGARLEALHGVGKALASLHDAAQGFAAAPGRDIAVAEYVRSALRDLAQSGLSEASLSAAEALEGALESDHGDILNSAVPWVLCQGNVQARDSFQSDDGRVWFCDFDRAVFAPALLDLMMMRVHWMMGSGGRALNVTEMADVFLGYHVQRPMSKAELAAMPVLWASFYASWLNTLCHRRRKQGRTDVEDLEQRIAELPEHAVEMGHNMLFKTGLM